MKKVIIKTNGKFIEKFESVCHIVTDDISCARKYTIKKATEYIEKRKLPNAEMIPANV